MTPPPINGQKVTTLWLRAHYKGRYPRVADLTSTDHWPIFARDGSNDAHAHATVCLFGVKKLKLTLSPCLHPNNEENCQNGLRFFDQIPICCWKLSLILIISAQKETSVREKQRLESDFTTTHRSRDSAHARIKFRPSNI